MILAGKPLSPAAECARHDHFVLVQSQMHQLGTVVCERCRDLHLGHAQRLAWALPAGEQILPTCVFP
jgi:hypothetical protein